MFVSTELQPSSMIRKMIVDEQEAVTPSRDKRNQVEALQRVRTEIGIASSSSYPSWTISREKFEYVRR